MFKKLIYFFIIFIITISCENKYSSQNKKTAAAKDTFEPDTENYKVDPKFKLLNKKYNLSKPIRTRFFLKSRWTLKEESPGLFEDVYFKIYKRKGLNLKFQDQDTYLKYNKFKIRCKKKICKILRGKRTRVKFKIEDPNTITVLYSSKFTSYNKRGKKYKKNKVIIPLKTFVRTADSLQLLKTIRGKVSAKSIQHNSHGLFFAQNMMYRHTITVYDRKYKLLKTIKDKIDLSKFGYSDYSFSKGAPVEAAFSHDGKYVWITQYRMTGKGYERKRYGTDICSPKDNYDRSFVFIVNTETLTIDDIVKVGSVPKAITISRDNKWAYVSNWCSYDLSVIDVEKKEEVRRIYLGAHPRDSVEDTSSNHLFVSMMGARRIAVIDLDSYKISWIKNTGGGPRHISIDPNHRFIYVSVKWSSYLLKIDLKRKKIIKRVRKRVHGPASMEITPDGKYLYVVNYYGNFLSKVRTSDMRVIKTVKTKYHPIGLTYDALTGRVWISCYSGYIMVYQG
jgi:YVTN family beta-propeller protein